MSDELVFYTHPMSRARIVRWMLEEVGEPYETKILEFGHSMKGPDYLAINPMGKVPAIRHGETVVTEAAAICAYLADAFPAAGLAPPPGSRERGPYYRWFFFAAGPVEAAVTDKALGFEIPVEREGMVGYGNLERTLAALEGALYRTEYIAGDRFTAADVYVGSLIGWGMAVPRHRQASGLRALLGCSSARAPRPSGRRRSTTSSSRSGEGGELTADRTMRLKGKTALVTGAGQGFGFGIAEIFVREGARVACLDLKADVAEAAAKRFGDAGAIALHADVSNRDDVERAAKAAIEAFGRVDIVVNNAGTTHRNKPLMEVEEAEFDRVFAVNVKSIFLTAQAFVPHMREQGGGVIINVGSTAALRPRPGLTVYNASKGAVHVMTKSMAVELAPDRIRVCALAPVAGETPLLAMFMGEDTPEKRAAFSATVPLGRFSTPARHRRRGALSRQRRGFVPDRRRAGGRRRALHLRE